MIFPLLPRKVYWLALMLALVSGASAQTNTNAPDSLAATQLELTNAYSRVLAIVNQPVKAYMRGADTSASKFSPGWFHPGATRPDFNTVDIRQTQEFPYNNSKFVTSDVTPGLVFLGSDLEFNSMTKYFYTNRTLPKHKLTEAQMLEVNRLYRIIGRCEGEIAKAKMASDLSAAPAEVVATNSDQSLQPAATTNGETETVVPGQSFESIRKIPKLTRILYGSILIFVLLLLVTMLRIFKKKSE